jgi:predicted RNA-binding Zn-ribbon protein involved in translation (DUF1610 family)
MSKTENTPETVYRIVMWVISTAFAFFLIGLGGKIIRDLPIVERPLVLKDFDASRQIEPMDRQSEELRTALYQLRQQRAQAQLASDHARAAYASEHQDFRNWLATRGITEDDTQNPEVIGRTHKLEGLGRAQRVADLEGERLDGEILKDQQDLDSTAERVSALRAQAQAPLEHARRTQELEVFGVRLAFTLPMLIAGVMAFRRKRTSRYWPLWRGFIGFALYCFFIELVPYLPSYGGYVRYSVGIILTLVAGHYAIRGMQAYLERRRETQKQEEAARREAMDKDSALRRIAANVCPSCEWKIETVNGLPSAFCVHCGLNLFSECGHCHTRMNSFFSHCGNCGKPLGAGDSAPRIPVPPVIG